MAYCREPALCGCANCIGAALCQLYRRSTVPTAGNQHCANCIGAALCQLQGSSTVPTVSAQHFRSLFNRTQPKLICPPGGPFLEVGGRLEAGDIIVQSARRSATGPCIRRPGRSQRHQRRSHCRRAGWAARRAQRRYDTDLTNAATRTTNSTTPSCTSQRLLALQQNTRPFLITTHTRLTALFQDYPGVPVPEGKTSLDFTEARDSEWQWHQLGHMQVCTLLQTDNHASTSPLSFLQTRCPSCRPINSVKALKAIFDKNEQQEQPTTVLTFPLP